MRAAAPSAATLFATPLRAEYEADPELNLMKRLFEQRVDLRPFQALTKPGVGRPGSPVRTKGRRWTPSLWDDPKILAEKAWGFARQVRRSPAGAPRPDKRAPAGDARQAAPARGVPGSADRRTRREGRGRVNSCLWANRSPRRAAAPRAARVAGSGPAHTRAVPACRPSATAPCRPPAAPAAAGPGSGGAPRR